jgi:hypothetical protein
VLEDSLVCVALCQGAALHFVDGENGVKDFDVWTFYAARLTTQPSRGAAARPGSSAILVSACRPTSRVS